MDRYRRLGLVLLVLLALAALLGAGSAAALRPPPATGAPLAASAAGAVDFDEAEEEGEAEAEAAEDDGQSVAEDCESDDQATEEACEERVEAKEEAEVEAEEAEECRLEGAEATVTTVPARDQVRLTVRYRTFEPSAVAIALELHGGKGALDLGTDTVHFGDSGTVHATETLTDAQMTRALAAREFTVAIQAVNTPRYCGEEFERHLTARKEAGGGLQWSDPGAAGRAKEARAPHA